MHIQSHHLQRVLAIDCSLGPALVITDCSASLLKMSGNVARKRKNQDRTDVVPKRFKTVSEPVSYSSPHINVKCYVSLALLCYLRHGRRNRGPILGACRGQFDTFPVSRVCYIIIIRRVSNVAYQRTKSVYKSNVTGT